ncbi:class F sortase [Streptomyces massasporeus]|uniref:class F sortase n=1 Tax=Streptomyces massasporeus TaxID=67324 RepID=UPI003815442A
MTSRHDDSASPPPCIPSVRLLIWTLVVGTVLMTGALHDGQPPQPSAGQAFSAPEAPAAPAAGRPAAADSAVQPLRPSEPLRIRIPAIAVDAPLTKLSLDSAGALRPPPSDEPDLAGWYGGGTTPGSVGTAITAGHVDLRTGRPGVFYGLGALAKGNTIEIDREDRRTAVFTVDAVEVHAKDSFPSEKVYGDSERAELRVITCGGGYAEHTGYQGNVVVYARLTAVE